MNDDPSKSISSDTGPFDDTLLMARPTGVAQACGSMNGPQQTTAALGAWVMFNEGCKQTCQGVQWSQARHDVPAPWMGL